MDSEKAKQIRANRLKLRETIKGIQLKKQQVKKETSEEEKPTPSRRKRRASLCLRKFEMLSTLKDASSSKGFNQFFQLHEKLGEGAQSIVYRCQQTLTGRNFAVKVTKRRDLQLMENMRQCYQILRVLHYENIIKGNFFFMDQKKLTCYLVCELCEYPTLKQFIVKHRKNKKLKKGFSEEVVVDVVQTILDCLVYLSEKGVCHRDIKPDNILYDPTQKDLKIIDFQLARMRRYSHQKLELWSNSGTLQYRAPQSFKSGYGISVDTWALGIICYQMLVGEVPFKSYFQGETVQQILNKQIDYQSLDISSSAKLFLKKILEKDPEKRLTPKEALSCPFILMNSNKCTLQSPSRLNSSVIESDDFLDFSENVSNKFYDEDSSNNFLETDNQNLGVFRND